MTTDGTAVEGRAAHAVTGYYRHVDADDVPGLLSLFAEEALYHRPGYAPLRGQAALRRFYTTERVIEAGRHELGDIVESGTHVAVHGVFTGVLKNGSEVRVGFADFFVLGSDGRFTERRTFFDAPAV